MSDAAVDPFEALFERGVTDGLPVVPPTRERVAAMVAGSGREASELIAFLHELTEALERHYGAELKRHYAAIDSSRRAIDSGDPPF